MLGRLRCRRLQVGVILIVLSAGAFASVGARAHVLAVYRHVIVRPFNLDGAMQVFVDCRQAELVEVGDKVEQIDLGWLDQDTRITMTALSTAGDAAWGFEMTSNGVQRFDDRQGRARAAGFDSEPHALVMAETVTAAGAQLGSIGCQPVALAGGDLTNYYRWRDDFSVPHSQDWDSPLTAQRPYFSLLDGGAQFMFVIVALIGFIAAALTSEIRGFCRRHVKGLTFIAVLSGVASILDLWARLGPVTFVKGVLVVGVVLSGLAGLSRLTRRDDDGSLSRL